MIDRQALIAQAHTLGFDLCGVAAATAWPELEHLDEWLARGYAGEMVYLTKSADVRSDIRKFLPTARSVIVTATNYYAPGGPDHHIARYAWGEDYHVVLANRLEQLVSWLRQQTAEPFDARVFVDKHPVQERAFASRAGIGWIGKNTLLINPEIGSYTFLAGVAVSVALDPGEPIGDLCGSCTLCLDACPTGALVDPYELDATRCISYLTIEHKGAIPDSQRPQIGDHVYGCDICQDVCPYNLAPLPTRDPAWQPRQGRADASPADMWERTDFELHQMVAGSAMTRVSLSRLRRNLAVVMANRGDAESRAAIDRPGGGVRRAAQSAETDLVQEHVAWAKAVLSVR